MITPAASSHHQMRAKAKGARPREGGVVLSVSATLIAIDASH